VPKGKMLSAKTNEEIQKILEFSNEEYKKLCSLIPLEETEIIIFENGGKKYPVLVKIDGVYQ